MVAHLLTASRAPGSALDTGAEDAADCKCYNDVGVHDMKGSIADAKSILGMMSLDYSHPVKIVCEDERDLNSVVNAIKQ